MAKLRMVHAWRTQAAWAKKKRERPKVGNNNGQLRIATPPRVAHAKPPGPKISFLSIPKVGERRRIKKEKEENTPGTSGWSRLHD